MASKMRREVVRSPVSCAVCARSRCVSGSLRQRLARLAGVAGGQRAIAGADGDDAAGQRIEPALLPAPVAGGGRRRPGSTTCGAAATTPAASSPHQQRQDDEGAEHAGLGDVVLPFDDDRARPVGQPVQAGGDGQNDEQEERRGGSSAWLRPAAGCRPSDDLSWRLDVGHGLVDGLARLDLPQPVLGGERGLGRQLLGLRQHLGEAAVLQRGLHARDDGLEAGVVGGCGRPCARARSSARPTAADRPAMASAGSASASSMALATLRKDLASSAGVGTPSRM